MAGKPISLPTHNYMRNISEAPQKPQKQTLFQKMKKRQEPLPILEAKKPHLQKRSRA